MPDNKKNEYFSKLVYQHQTSLKIYIRYLGAENHSIEDIAQEAFIIAYQKLHLFDSNLGFGAWLGGIARNILRNELRKSARQQRIKNTELTHHLLIESEQDNQNAWIDSSKLNNLDECLSKLPPNSRSMIEQRYKEQNNSSILSERSGKSPTAIRVSLMRIREKLKSCIEAKTDDN